MSYCQACRGLRQECLGAELKAALPLCRNGVRPMHNFSSSPPSPSADFVCAFHCCFADLTLYFSAVLWIRQDLVFILL